MARPSFHQMERLIQFLEENPSIARGYIMRTSQARHSTKLKWEEIAIELNSLGGAIKDAKAWAKVWTDKKYSLKKVVAKRNSSARRTGGGVDILPPLTEMDEKLVSILGGTSFALGNSELSVPLGVPIEREDQLGEVVMIEYPQTGDVEPSMREPSQQVDPLPPSPTQSPHRPRRRAKTRLDAEKERLIRIEEKRVEAEQTTAEALKSVGGGLHALVNAIAVAGERRERALEAIANAIMVIGARIGQSTQKQTT